MNSQPAGNDCRNSNVGELSEFANQNEPGEFVNTQSPHVAKKAIVFGSQDNLVGVLHAPTEDARPTGVVMLTAGMLPSCGPYRLHSQLAERLALQKTASLSFDLSGIGESLGVGSAGTSIDRASAETGAAIDTLCDTTNCDRVILFGLCSGADDAVAAAGKDDRVVGLILLDGFGYRTRRFHWNRLLNHYLYRALQSSTWKRQWQKLQAGGSSAKTMPDGLDIREFPPADEMTIQLQQLLNREVQMHFIYTGGVADYYNHDQQLWDMVPGVHWHDLASTRFFADMDHTAMLCEDRAQLIQEIMRNVEIFSERSEDSERAGATEVTEDVPAVFPPVGFSNDATGTITSSDTSIA